MIPEIIIYEEGRIIVTPAAFAIPELRSILNKYDDADPYLMYVYQMSHPLSPYINLPKDEIKEMAVFDVMQTMGDFDPEDELLEPAIMRMREFFESRTQKYYDALGRIMDRVIEFSHTARVTSENVMDANRMLKDGGATMRSYKDAEKQVEEELKTKMKGKAKLGDY